MDVGTRPDFDYSLAARVAPLTFAPLWMTAFHLWTTPFRQGKTLGSLLRVVGCCHLSGLGCGTMTAAGLYGSSMLARKPKMLVTVALANKMARIVWALLVKGGTYRTPTAAA